jgi:2-oxoglutarate/2-oxoacid ferredoxin oxidoreductase subunit alpha
MGKVLMKGNEAIGEAAIRAGCLHFFGYPITPQSELPEYLARRLPELGGAYVQAESEVAAINMLFGAAGVGQRVLTSSSSPGISLMSEGISYIAGCELPVVIVNIMRGGPGLGGILPAQSDYLHATKGLAHGDFDLVVYAPSSVQEAVDHTIAAFDVAERYRTPVMIIGDGMIGQMMEPVTFPDVEVGPPMKADDWALTGCKGREKRVVSSLFLDAKELHRQNVKRREQFLRIAENETRFEAYNCDGEYDILVTAFGMMSRIAKTAVTRLKKEGIEVGLFRPVTVKPFPYAACREAMEKARGVLCVELNLGQMLVDVKLAAEGARPVSFFGRAGGFVPSVEEVMSRLKELKTELEAGGAR